MSVGSDLWGEHRRNGLPETTLDSFVLQAKGNADAIYGDEGTVGLPPFGEPGFTPDHRIERGITGDRSKGLTTGHGSVLPAAWGGDEFVKGSEFSLSGTETLAPVARFYAVKNVSENVDASYDSSGF